MTQKTNVNIHQKIVDSRGVQTNFFIRNVFLEAHIVWEREIGILASPLAMGLGWDVKIIIMQIYDSGKESLLE
jgi:hypothetical protein